METKRRKHKRHVKMDTENIESSDSDVEKKDVDHERTMQIITRLSQKYLKTTGSPVSDSQTTDTELEYYGDEENSPEDTDNSDVTMASPKRYQPKDNNLQLRIVLSPVRLPFNSQSNLKSIPSKSQCSTPVASVGLDTMEKQARCNQSNVVLDASLHRQSRKRKSTPSSDTSTSASVETVKSVRRTSPRVKVNPAQDSAIFISPPIQKGVKLCSTQTTSTPSSTSRTKQLIKDTGYDSCFGFDNLGSPSLDVSPVKRAITPMSDYCSMSSTLFSSMDASTTQNYEQVDTGHMLMDIEESEDKQKMFLNKSSNSYNTKAKPNKKRKSRKPKISEKAEKWAEKMNKEFEELENFELSIEG